jgi:hypothetical protein
MRWLNVCGMDLCFYFHCYFSYCCLAYGLLQMGAHPSLEDEVPISKVLMTRVLVVWALVIPCRSIRKLCSIDFGCHSVGVGHLGKLSGLHFGLARRWLSLSAAVLSSSTKEYDYFRCRDNDRFLGGGLAKLNYLMLCWPWVLHCGHALDGAFGEEK